MTTWRLECGDWRTALADVDSVSCLCADPPYGKRTHEGNDDLPEGRASLGGYASWSPADVREFALHWSPRVRGWMACMTDDELAPHFRAAYREAGRLDFAAVPILQHRPRLTGDGPGSGAVYLMVARPRRKEFLSWGSLPCWYISEPDKTGIVNGAKPLRLMQAIVRDYSRPGDVVCDPTCGGATTLLAAVMEGRHAIGAELSEDTCRKAHARLSRPYTMSLFPTDRPAAEQSALDL